jgi:N-acetylglucosaminyldiphosphoundecaprenol N-acetyl-beta-D-mannosaminyltransferase
LRRRLAAAAREYVVDRHSHLTAAEAYVGVYNEAAKRRRVEGERSPSPLPWSSVSVLGFRLDIADTDVAASWLAARASARIAGRGGRGSKPIEGSVPLAGSNQAAGLTHVAVSFNPELVMRALRDPVVAEALLEADLAYPDGVGAVWAARRQGVPGVRRTPGIELAEALLREAAARRLPVYLLGAAEGVAEEAARRVQERYPELEIAGTAHGYFSAAEEEEVVAAVRESHAAVLLVALGAPRQEVFLHRHRSALDVPVALGVGGSFDVWAGRVERAPDRVRSLGLEWLYRLVTDPGRWRRQVALPRFAAAVLRGSPDDYGPGRAGRGRNVEVD